MNTQEETPAQKDGRIEFPPKTGEKNIGVVEDPTGNPRMGATPSTQKTSPNKTPPPGDIQRDKKV